MDIEKLKKFVPSEEKEKNEADIIKEEIQAKKDQIDKFSEEINDELYDKFGKIAAADDIEQINKLIEDGNDIYNEAVQAENENDFHEARLRYNEAVENFINIRRLMVQKISNEKPKIEEEKALSSGAEQWLTDLEMKLNKILNDVDSKLGNNSITGEERNRLRDKQTELGAILRFVYKKEKFDKILKFIKNVKNLSEQEKDSLFKVLGISSEELNQKENNEKEIIYRIREKLKEYIEIEDKIINQENTKPKAEKNEKKIGAAETRKKAYKHILKQTLWDLETYKKAVESNHDKVRGFTTLSDKRYEELMKIIAGEKSRPVKGPEIKRKEEIFDKLKNKKLEIRNKLLEVEKKFINEFEGKVNESEEGKVNILLNDANQAFNEAVENLESGNFEEAAMRFDEVLETADVAMSLMNEILKLKLLKPLEKTEEKTLVAAPGAEVKTEEELAAEEKAGIEPVAETVIKKTEEEKIRDEILEFFGVEIGDRVKVVFDDEEAKEFGVKEDFGIVADARIELVPVEDEAKEPEKEEVIIIKFKNENIGKLFIAKNEENRKDVKKATDEEREKMILSELDEEVKRMSGVLNARMVLGEITRDEHSKKNSVLEWIEKSKDIKTAKEMIGKALNAEGGINEEEARKLYGILEIPEDEINELVKMEELSSEDKIKIKKIKGVISHNRLTLTKLYEDKKDDVIFKGTIKTLDLIEGSRTVKEVIKNIRKSAAIQPLEGGISLGFARDFFKALEMPESEIEKELFLIYVLRTIFDNIPRFEIKGIKREELDLEKILNNEELLNKIAVEDNLKISYTALLGEVDKENWIAKIAEFIKKELAAGGEEKLPEKKEIEIKGFADIERFLVEKKGKPRNARMEEIDARLEEIARILKKAGVTAHKTE